MGWNDSGAGEFSNLVNIPALLEYGRVQFSLTYLAMADTAAWETANKWDGGNEAGNDNWNDGGNAADTGAASGWDGKEAGDAGDAGDQRACRL
jgi:hypothetical protein